MSNQMFDRLAACRRLLIDMLARNAELEREIACRTKETLASQDLTLLVLTRLAATRDQETGKHLARTQLYLRTLAERLRGHPRFSTALTADNIELMCKSAPLHDIGKIGIPDHILCKPGRLTPAEFEIMKTHTTLGHAALAQAEAQLGYTPPFLAFAKELTLSHQEKWDGSGYPQGLAGDAIPVSARLMAVADVYDALVSVRPYKRPYSHEDAVALMARGRGTHFDPDVLNAFLAIQQQCRAIAARHADLDPGLVSTAEDGRMSA
jgi:putative two-component system response regulator